MTALYVLAFLLFLSGFVAANLLAPRKAVAAFWVIACLVGPPVWIGTGIADPWPPMNWFKSAIVLGPTAVVMILLCLRSESGFWIGQLIRAMIAMNILQISAATAAKGVPLPLVAGCLLVASMGSWKRYRIGDLRGRTTLLVEYDWVWILAFTVWNFSCLLTYYDGARAVMHIAVLLSPLPLAAAFGPAHWLFARGFALAGFFLVHNFGYRVVPPLLQTPESWLVPEVRWGVAGLGLVLAAGAALRVFLRWRGSEAAPPASPEPSAPPP